MNISIIVTGATGYIAQHVIAQLLERKYNVIGTVRSSEKGDYLKRLFNCNNFSYEVIDEIGRKGAFDLVLKRHPEVTVFIHTASPVHFNATDIENEMLLPAIEGTKNALVAIQEHGSQVERVVITSSYVAVMDITKNNGKILHLTENDWNPITWEEAKADPYTGYIGSKTFSEKSAWEFVKDEKPRFKLSVVNPSYVFGPQLFDSEVKETLGTSAEIFNQILKYEGDESALSNITGYYIDVRDVAKAHIIAFEKEAAIGKRLVLVSDGFTTQTIVDTVNQKFPQLKGKIYQGKPGTDREKIEKMDLLNTERTKAILGFEYFNLSDTISDSFDQLIKVRGLD